MAFLFGRATDWLVRHKGRIGIIAMAHTLKTLEEFLLDWVLYGTVIAWASAKFGPLYGTLIAFSVMGSLSAFLCYWYLRAYDWSECDWFGFEILKSVRDDDSARLGWFARVIRWVARKGTIPAFFILSVRTDPFMTTVYLRKKESRYRGLTGRDLKIFWASVLVSNGYWALQWAGMLGLARLLLGAFL
jgi:hypothetical protein